MFCTLIVICIFLLIYRCILSSFYVLCIVLSICASAWYATLGWAGFRLAKLRISYLTNGRRHDELKLWQTIICSICYYGEFICIQELSIRKLILSLLSCICPQLGHSPLCHSHNFTIVGDVGVSGGVVMQSTELCWSLSAYAGQIFVGAVVLGSYRVRVAKPIATHFAIVRLLQCCTSPRHPRNLSLQLSAIAVCWYAILRSCYRSSSSPTPFPVSDACDHAVCSELLSIRARVCWISVQEFLEYLCWKLCIAMDLVIWTPDLLHLDYVILFVVDLCTYFTDRLTLTMTESR